MSTSSSSAKRRIFAIVCLVALVIFVTWFAWAAQHNRDSLNLAEAQINDGNWHEAEVTLFALHGGIVAAGEGRAAELLSRIEQHRMAIAASPESSSPLVEAPPVETPPVQALSDSEPEVNPAEEILSPAASEALASAAAEVQAQIAAQVERERLNAVNEHLLAYGWEMVWPGPHPWVEALEAPTAEQIGEGKALLARHQLITELRAQWPGPDFPTELQLELQDPLRQEDELLTSFNQCLLQEGWVAVLTDPAPWVTALRTPSPQQQADGGALLARHALSEALKPLWTIPALPAQLIPEIRNPQRTEFEIRAEFLRLFQEEMSQSSARLETGAWKQAVDAKSAQEAMQAAGALVVLLKKPGLPAAEVAGLLKRVQGIEAEARTVFQTRAARDARLAEEGLNPFQAQGWTIVDQTAGYGGFANKLLDPNTGITFILVAPGQFQMGSPAAEAEREADEKPHLVKMSKGFYLGETEVTQAQWKKMVPGNPSPSSFIGAGLPVESVSWNDCQEFLQAAGNGYRLPTEQEWEYACRAATLTPFSYGPTIDATMGNFNGREVYGGGVVGSQANKTTLVGSLQANPWGFQDMHGNLWEWCSDWYGPYSEPAPEAGSERVLRGGAWNSHPKFCRAANRYMAEPDTRNYIIGFRVAHDLP